MNKRNLVNIIKRGDRVPDPPGVDMSNPTSSTKGSDPNFIGPPNTSPSTTGNNAPHTNQSVMKMQQAAEELSNKIKSSSIPVNMPQGLIENLSKISEQVKGQQAFADGSWGPITDTALHNIVNFANSLILLSERFGLPSNIYNKGNADNFNNILSQYQVVEHHISLNQEEQSEAASILIKHIGAISKLYSYLLEKVPTINNEHILNPKEKQAIQSGKTFVQYNGQNIDIPLSALTSMGNYDKLMKSLNLDDKAKIEILDLIIDKP
ncbi:MAG TPA: hypothetical protein VII94_04660, partial [Candidatus Saccharimonadales bacterium]